MDKLASRPQSLSVVIAEAMPMVSNSKGKSVPSPRRPLSSDDLADLAEQFDDCDVDGDQCIDFAEFSQLLENLESEVPPAQRRTRFEAIDLDHDGAISRHEFMQWWRGA